MGAVVHLAQGLETITCWAREGCGIQFACPEKFLQVAKEQGTVFHCPRGHALRFGESDVEKLKKEVEREKQRREWAETNERAANERVKAARHDAAVVRGKLKAQSERVKNGVCPCCKRTFQNLQRHMTSKHPDFAPKAEK